MSIDANLLLLVASRMMILPQHYTIVPPNNNASSGAGACRIFHTALSQGQCGSCAAFAVAALIGMRACLFEHRDFIPSPYRIFDCCPEASCEDGTSVHRAAAVANFGVGDLRSSPLVYGLPCKMESQHALLKVPLRLSHVAVVDPLAIKTALWLYGPLLGRAHRSLSPHAFEDNAQETHEKSHAVVVVGWDADSKWILQNSWGEEWGDAYGRGSVTPETLHMVVDPSVRDTMWICLVALLGTVIALSVTLAFGEKSKPKVKTDGCAA